jgi:SAM-dependent methyltransferase
VLVFGLGSGRNLPPLFARGARVDALEEDALRAAVVSQRFQSEAGLRIVTGSYAGPLPFEDDLRGGDDGVEDGGYDGALSTHALLHGTRADASAVLASLAGALRPNAPLHLVLGSRSDPRCGRGAQLEDGVYVAEDGSEAGVPHVYFDEAEARAALAALDIVSLEERSAAQTAGRWAHSGDEAETIVHWFVRARRR